jgi:hypothetical protein
MTRHNIDEMGHLAALAANTAISRAGARLNIKCLPLGGEGSNNGRHRDNE